MVAATDLPIVLATSLANPVTPWVVLALCITGWLLVYLVVTSEREG
jgi:hypothetical protein